MGCLTHEENGRDDWIRTSDLLTPSEARYHAALRPDNGIKKGGREPTAV